MPTVHTSVTRKASGGLCYAGLDAEHLKMSCCRDNLLWSMVLNPVLVIPPIYAKREPALRKKKGRPTEKRGARLREKEKEEEEDVLAYVDKAKPRLSAYSLLL